MPVRHTSNDLPGRPRRRRAFTALLACALIGLGATRAPSAITCKPILSIKNVREIRAASSPIKPWVWKATVVADTDFCATDSGAFEIDFVRIKEYSPDVQFTEKYRWGTGQFDVIVELTADESIHNYRIGFILPCVCRELPYK